MRLVGRLKEKLADTEKRLTETTFDQRGEKLSPVDFGLRKRDADAEDGSFSIG